jgi:hypothetical protein
MIFSHEEATKTVLAIADLELTTEGYDETGSDLAATYNAILLDCRRARDIMMKSPAANVDQSTVAA